MDIELIFGVMLLLRGLQWNRKSGDVEIDIFLGSQ